MAVSWQTALKNKAKKNATLCVEDVDGVLKQFSNLVPKIQNYTFEDGKETQLFVLDGTIPVIIQGVTYNIPVCVLLQQDHPYVPPLVYVRPTSSMAIRPSQYVDTNGRVYHPYLHQWNYKTSYITTLVQILCGVFAERSPVYAKSASPAHNSQGVTRHNEAHDSASTPPNPTLQREESQKDCIVCMDNKSNSVLLPCGHLGVCMECASALKTSTKMCPICRLGITEVTRVYQP